MVKNKLDKNTLFTDWIKEFRKIAVKKGLVIYFGFEGIEEAKEPLYSRDLRARIEARTASSSDIEKFNKWLNHKQEFTTKCTQALELIEQSISTEAWILVQAGVEGYDRPVVQSLTNIMNFLRLNYGGSYSVLRDQNNREMADRIPAFEKLQSLLSGIDRLRKLRSERRGWDPVGTHDFSPTWLNTWLVRRLIRPEAQVISGEIARNIRGNFLDNLERVTNLYRGMADLEELRGSSSLITGVSSLSSQVYAATTYQEQNKRGQRESGSENKRDGESFFNSKNMGNRVNNLPAKQVTARRCWRCGSTDHISKSCTTPFVENLPQSSVMCFRCGGRGHEVRECPSPASTSPSSPKFLGQKRERDSRPNVVIQSSDGRSRQVPQHQFKRMRVAYAQWEKTTDQSEEGSSILPTEEVDEIYEVENDFFDGEFSGLDDQSSM